MNYKAEKILILSEIELKTDAEIEEIADYLVNMYIDVLGK